MKWFKHLSGSLNSDFVYGLIEKFGSDGYLVFFGTLELMSDEFDIFNPGISEISYKKLTKNLQLSRTKTTRILTEIHQKAEKDPLKKTGFLVEFKKDSIVVNSNRLKKLCDNHTSKLMKDALKLLQSDIEVTSSQEVRSKKKEVRSKIKDNKHILQKDFYLTKKKRKLTGKRLETFLLFMEYFKDKRGKAAAADSWLDIPELTDKLTSQIYEAAKIYASGRDDLIRAGSTPKMAQGWLTDRRWEDEIKKPEKLGDFL